MGGSTGRSSAAWWHPAKRIPVPSAPFAADSKFIVISGQHISKALQLEVADLRRQHREVPPTMEQVTATVVPRDRSPLQGENPKGSRRRRAQLRASFAVPPCVRPWLAGMGGVWDRSPAPKLDSTDIQRKLAAGKGQLAQNMVNPLKLSEWASLHLHPDVMAERDRQNRLSISLLMAGLRDVADDKV